MATENPAFAGAEELDAGDETAVDIEAGLKDGTLTAEQAVVLQERQMARMEQRAQAEMAQLEARLRAELGGQTGIAATVRGIVARLTETPTNFHQATVHFLATDAPEDEAMARRAPLLYAGSLAMVLLQSATAAGVWIGTMRASCVSSDQCDEGTFCSVGWRDRCSFCGDGGPVGHIGNLTLVAEVCTMPYSERKSASRCASQLEPLYCGALSACAANCTTSEVPKSVEGSGVYDFQNVARRKRGFIAPEMALAQKRRAGERRLVGERTTGGSLRRRVVGAEARRFF